MLPTAMRPMWEAVAAGVTRPVADAARSVVREATNPTLQDQPGVVLGVDAKPSGDLTSHVTPQITVAVRELTERVLGEVRGERVQVGQP